jgi:hypothetical protein
MAGSERSSPISYRAGSARRYLRTSLLPQTPLAQVAVEPGGGFGGELGRGRRDSTRAAAPPAEAG